MHFDTPSPCLVHEIQVYKHFAYRRQARRPALGQFEGSRRGQEAHPRNLSQSEPVPQ